MPTTIEKTFYACDKCKHEYVNFHNAFSCENVPTLEEVEKLKEFEIGEEINFNNEYPSGSRWVYCSEVGIVSEKKLVRQGEMHQYLYWTQEGAGVVMNKDSFGDWRTFSPAELKRRTF